MPANETATQSAERDKIVERIRKILSKTDAGANAPEAEIEAALRMARRLMEQYNLSDAEVYRTDAGQQSLYDQISQFEVYRRVGMDRFDFYLAMVPASLCDCGMFKRVVMAPNKRGRMCPMDAIYFYGLSRDVAVAQAMYIELLATMRAMVRIRYGEVWQDNFSSYCHGFVDRLRQRVDEMKTESTTENNCTAIVIAKDALVRRWADANLSLKTAKARTAKVHPGAYNAGHQDGNAVSLGKNQISTKRKELS